MATMKLTGFEEYEKKLSRMGEEAEQIIGKAIYQGADIVADCVKKEIKELPVDEHFGTQKNPAKGIRAIQKKGLLDSFGITPMKKDDGVYHVKLGFDGYNEMKTKKHPKGQPNQMIARAAESGTTFSKKTRFMSRAINRSKKPMEAKMGEVVDQEIERIMK